MKQLSEIYKKSPFEFAKRMIRKQFPKLAEEVFEVREERRPCDSCGHEVRYFEINIEGQKEWKQVPGKEICINCEDKELAINAYEYHKKMLSDRVTSQFWMVPPELENETLASYQPKDNAQTYAFQAAVNFFKDYQKGDKYNLIFRGTYGGGKSHLLKGVADAIKKMKKTDPSDGYEMPMTVGYLEFEKLLGMIKGTWGRRDGQTESDIMKLVIDLDFLVIDDLGTESGEWAGRKLFEIINGRLGKSTAYSTNFMKMEDLAKRFEVNGGKIVSRLHANTQIVDVITDDMRMEKRRG